MPVLERRVSLRGVRFWVDGQDLMFCNQVDSCTRDGPRLATSEDRDAHPKAYAEAAAGDGPEPLAKLLHVSGDAPPKAPKPHIERSAPSQP
jgi:hypothetical protein